MRCLRFDIRRTFVPYLEGTISPRAARRLEAHLPGCADCRRAFARLRSGHRFAQGLRGLDPQGVGGAPEFDPLMEDAGRVSGSRWRRGGIWELWFDELTTPRVVLLLAVIVLAQSALLVVSNRRALFPARSFASSRVEAIDFSRFRSLSIPELPANTQPHVATEGWVRDVRLDEEEKTLHFTLAQIPQGPGPFVVCEIMNTGGVAAPREGSRVRVYGVARYDGQTGREWYEVNPVLNVAVIK